MGLELYCAVKDQMKTGDLLQWQSDSLVGGIIRWKTGSDVNHSSMVIRLSEYEGEERRRFHTEAMERGVYPNLLSARLDTFKGKVWWLPLKDEWDPKRVGIGRRLTEMWGREYDYGSLFRQLMGAVNADGKQLFCSEACYLALGFTGAAPNPGEMEGLKVHKAKILIREG
jgi:hypothetical protein